jgi:hypothetical protein
MTSCGQINGIWPFQSHYPTNKQKVSSVDCKLDFDSGMPSIMIGREVDNALYCMNMRPHLSALRPTQYKPLESTSKVLQDSPHCSF